MSELVCLGCGSSETFQVCEESKGPVSKEVRECPHCHAKGTVMCQFNMVDGNVTRSVISGKLAQMSDEGAELFKENMGFVPVYER